MARKATDSRGPAILCHLDRLLAEKQMTLTDLSARVGISLANLSILKNDRAQAVRFSTLAAVCEVLQCEVGDLLTTARDAPREQSSPSPGDS